VGPDQLFVFVSTLLVTLATDLLVGVGVGLVLEVAVHLTRGAGLGQLFRTQIESRTEEDTLVLVVRGCSAFTNLRSLARRLDGLPPEVKCVVVDFTEARLVDHTVQERLHRIADEWPDRRLVIRGLETHEAASDHCFAARWRREAG
jgi:MFS superfamily sulfate permease-like transporter